jgi:molybdopterin converting factor subunit 1
LVVLLFAGLAEELGARELLVDGPVLPGTVGELTFRLREQWPALAGRPFRVALNQAYAPDDASVAPGDELALIPPVSGG